jgi:hypothetical protein
VCLPSYDTARQGGACQRGIDTRLRRDCASRDNKPIRHARQQPDRADGAPTRSLIRPRPRRHLDRRRRPPGVLAQPPGARGAGTWPGLPEPAHEKQDSNRRSLIPRTAACRPGRQGHDHRRQKCLFGVTQTAMSNDQDWRQIGRISHDGRDQCWSRSASGFRSASVRIDSAWLTIAPTAQAD